MTVRATNRLPNPAMPRDQQVAMERRLTVSVDEAAAVLGVSRDSSIGILRTTCGSSALVVAFSSLCGNLTAGSTPLLQSTDPMGSARAHLDPDQGDAAAQFVVRSRARQRFVRSVG